MADIQLETPAGPVSAVLEVPAGGGPAGGGSWPGVVIVHDAFGLNEDTRTIARRFADQGYLALAPDLYSRGGMRRCVVGVFRALLGQRGVAVDDLLGAREYLLAREDVTDSIGIVGFCMGGGFALLLAPRGFGASAPFYGVSPKDMEKALDGACPIIASYGKNDPSLIGAGKKLEKVLSDKRIPHDVKTYPGAGHGFANALPGNKKAAVLRRVSGLDFKEEQAEDAFARVFDFFDRHLH